MLGILAGGDEDPAAGIYRRGHDVVLRPAAAQFVLGVLAIEIALPEKLAGGGIERAKPTITLADDHLAAAFDLDYQRC